MNPKRPRLRNRPNASKPKEPETVLNDKIKPYQETFNITENVTPSVQSPTYVGSRMKQTTGSKLASATSSHGNLWVVPPSEQEKKRKREALTTKQIMDKYFHKPGKGGTGSSKNLPSFPKKAKLKEQVDDVVEVDLLEREANQLKQSKAYLSQHEPHAEEVAAEAKPEIDFFEKLFSFDLFQYKQERVKQEENRAFDDFEIDTLRDVPDRKSVV